MFERKEIKEKNLNLYNVNSIFGNFLNDKPEKNPINLQSKIKNESNQIKSLLTKYIEPHLKKRKPSPLKKLEKLMGEYFFGKNGKFTYLIPHLKTELKEKEIRKKEILKSKISIGELTFLQNKSYDNTSIERIKEVQKNILIKSPNFQKEKQYYNYEKFKLKSKKHKKMYSTISPDLLKSLSTLSVKRNNKKFSQTNKNKKQADELLITTVNKFNLYSDNLKNKIKKKQKHKRKSELGNSNLILSCLNFSSPKIYNKENNKENNKEKNKENNKENNKEKNNIISFSKINKKGNSSSSLEKNINQIIANTLTTSVNSGSNNSLSINPVSSFKISKSSIKTSSFLSCKNNYNINNNINNNNSNNNNNENGIMSNSFYIKNAIANVNFGESDNKKNNKKNQINLLRVSASEKQLLIPEYSVQKPFILNSYLNFNKKNINNNHKINKFDFPKISKKEENLSHNRRSTSYSIHKNSFNQKFKELIFKLDNIYSYEKKNSKSLQKIIHKNQINSKIYKILNKDNSKSLLKGDIEKLKLVLEDNIKNDKSMKLYYTERIENDNKLIDTTKNLNDNIIENILSNAINKEEEKKKTLNVSKVNHKKFKLWKKKFIEKNSNKIQYLNAILIKEKNKVMNMINKNFEKIKYKSGNNSCKSIKVKLMEK